MQPGHRVLDLCAAPGGKSTHIAAKLQNRGLLVANELTATRVTPLLHNLERFGSPHYAVTSCRAETMAKALPDYFDRILVDAPCSGEGLFRKDPHSRQEWHPRHPQRLARTQFDLLKAAFAMLKPGGRLVYATCTFAEEENEQLVDTFLAEHPAASVVSLAPAHGLEITEQGYGKLLPHLMPGEGHFCATLHKSENRPATSGTAKNMVIVDPDRATQREWNEFAAVYLPVLPAHTQLHQHSDKLYLVAAGLPELSACNLIRPGLLMGRLRGRSFVPEHGLALAAFARNLPILDFGPGDPQLTAYLRGEALNADSNVPKGWLLIACDGYPLSLGKHSEGRINNRLPKGLRLL
ncbi:MAG TPA: RsmB/NOP family class I SAM-dependent RNA methyltransferase [Bacillota bacterium]|nr:RsmB/NOP family class I SAM-dependent RNA methyltransferase [Bacillota bacterium]